MKNLLPLFCTILALSAVAEEDNGLRVPESLLRAMRANQGVSIGDERPPEEIPPVSCDDKLPAALSVAPVVTKLSQELTMPLGMAPLFCRSQIVPSDSKKDQDLKKEFDELALKNAPNVKSGVVIAYDTRKILKMAALKKMWMMSNEETRKKALLSSECSSDYLNRSPFYIYGEKNKNAIENQEKVLKDFHSLCTIEVSEDPDKALAPYLTNDVVADAFEMLKSLYPNNFRVVKTALCGIFEGREINTLGSDYQSFAAAPISDNKLRGKYFTWANEKTNKVPYKMLIGLQGREGDVDDIMAPHEFDQFKKFSKGEKGVDEKALAGGLHKVASKRGDVDNDVLFKGVVLSSSLKKSLEKGHDVDLGLMEMSGRSGDALSEIHTDEIDSLKGDKAVLVVKAKSCVSSSLLATESNEDNYVCPPGLKFKSTALGGNVYELREVGLVDKTIEKVEVAITPKVEEAVPTVPVVEAPVQATASVLAPTLSTVEEAPLVVPAPAVSQAVAPPSVESAKKVTDAKGKKRKTRSSKSSRKVPPDVDPLPAVVPSHDEQMDGIQKQIDEAKPGEQIHFKFTL